MLESVRDTIVRARDSHLSRDRGISGSLRLLCGASDASTHLVRSTTQLRSFLGFCGEL